MEGLEQGKRAWILERQKVDEREVTADQAAGSECQHEPPTRWAAVTSESQSCQLCADLWIDHQAEGSPHSLDCWVSELSEKRMSEDASMGRGE